jgi:hypothetical protein
MKLHNAMWPGLVGKEPDTVHTLTPMAPKVKSAPWRI